MSKMIELNLKAEVVNTTLHVLGGGLISYALIPLSPWWLLLLVAGTFGGLREALQEWRGKKQPWWIIVIDVLGWIVGAGIGWFPTL